ncbi:MAG: OsmC family protein [Thermodesulfobacteriota bacterium]
MQIRKKGEPAGTPAPAANLRQAEIKWVKGFQFVGRGDSGHAVVMDANQEIGGGNTAARPTELVLIALGGCTGIDVVNILTSMRLKIASLEIQVRAEPVEELPKSFREIWIKYVLRGDVPEKKLREAIELSKTKYCSVGAMLSPGAKINYQYEIIRPER